MCEDRQNSAEIKLFLKDFVLDLSKFMTIITLTEGLLHKCYISLRRAMAEFSRESFMWIGVAVTRFYKQGSHDYKSVPQLEWVNLDSYRGQAKEEVRVTVVKDKTLC